MSSIIDLPERARVACVLYMRGYLSPSQAIERAGYTVLDPEAEFIVKPNLPWNMEISFNGEITIRRRWQRRQR